jgi:hypothetical protein
MRIVLRPKTRYHFSDDADIEREEALLGLFGGTVNYARVGRISDDLARLIDATTAVVILTSLTMQKIRGKHTEIGLRDILAIQHGFNNGRVHMDRPCHLTFYYPDPYAVDRTIKAVVKATKFGELLFQTHHQLEPRRLRSAIKTAEKTGTLIRDWPR